MHQQSQATCSGRFNHEQEDPDRGDEGGGGNEEEISEQEDYPEDDLDDDSDDDEMDIDSEFLPDNHFDTPEMAREPAAQPVPSAASHARSSLDYPTSTCVSPVKSLSRNRSTFEDIEKSRLIVKLSTPRLGEVETSHDSSAGISERSTSRDEERYWQSTYLDNGVLTYLQPWQRL